jgi:hypothetical protein
MAQNFQLSGTLRRERGGWLLRLAHYREAIVELRAAQAELPGDPRTTALLEEAERRAAELPAGK